MVITLPVMDFAFHFRKYQNLNSIKKSHSLEVGFF